MHVCTFLVYRKVATETFCGKLYPSPVYSFLKVMCQETGRQCTTTCRSDFSSLVFGKQFRQASQFLSRPLKVDIRQHISIIVLIFVIFVSLHLLTVNQSNSTFNLTSIY